MVEVFAEIVWWLAASFVAACVVSIVVFLGAIPFVQLVYDGHERTSLVFAFLYTASWVGLGRLVWWAHQRRR